MLKKIKELLIGDVDKLEWKDFDHKKVYAALAILIAVVALIVVLIVSALKGDGTEESGEVPVEESQMTEEQQGDISAEEEAEEDSLKENAYPEIVELVTAYMNGIANGDTDAVAATVDVLDEQEKNDIIAKSDYIEAYNNVICYTKKGMEENSYVTFAYYEMKILNIDTTAPGMMALYISQREDGSYYIFNGEASPEMEAFVLALAEEAEVAALIENVEVKYQEAMNSDENLANFNAKIQESKQEAEAEEQEAAQPTEEVTEPEGESQTSEEDTASQEPAGELTEPVITLLKDTIKLRSERSTDSEIVTYLSEGTDVRVYASYDDGWSKIKFGDMSGYCKTEFLESTEGVPMLSVNGDTQPETPAEPEETEEPQQSEEQEAAPAEEATTMNRKMRLKEAVKIRSGRSTDSEAITTAWQSEYVDAIESYGDGWCKVVYNGQTGYCKTSFLEEVTD